MEKGAQGKGGRGVEPSGCHQKWSNLGGGAGEPDEASLWPPTLPQPYLPYCKSSLLDVGECGHVN